jgi:ergothioneine biosynthesis protein EgtB
VAIQYPAIHSLDRAGAIDWYRRNRKRSAVLFDLLSADAYYSQPIALRHPIVFYEGHLPAFSFNTLAKKGLGQPGIDARLESLFARGIDPSETDDPGRNAKFEWPSRDVVRAFAAEADRRVIEALEHADLEQPGHPLLDRAQAVYAILEHEAMHQETLLYMWHRLPFEQKRAPAGYQPRTTGAVPAQEWIHLPGGIATLGTDRETVRFAWDNECPGCSEQVAAFEIDRHDVTNAAFMEFVDAAGYDDQRWWTADDFAWIQGEPRHPLFWERHDGEWYWRGMFGLVPLPVSWPVYVSHAEAAAFARWRGGRLPTEAEFQRAAYGAADGQERRFPWGDAPASSERGVFDFSSWDPEPAGSHAAGRSAWGIDDLVGNGWEWTSTPFRPFPGFQPIPSYPEYSADFFDDQHFVMKGASPATARELLRPTFRNWFRAHYPYVYATFRCVRTTS